MFAYEYMLSVYLLQVRWMAAWQNGRKGLELFFYINLYYLWSVSWKWIWITCNTYFWTLVLREEVEEVEEE